jgi:hypothetical protein
MKRVVVFSFLLAVLLSVTPIVHAQSQPISIQQGTQVRLSLISGLSTSVARDGDPFTAVVAEPVFMGNQLLLPAGAKIHGTITSVQKPKWFAMERGGATLNLVFNTVEVESRIFPVQMSILSIYSGSAEDTKKRKDLKTTEGVVVEQKRDLKSDLMLGGLGTGGGAVVGLIFSNVARGTVIGLVGTSAYICTKKGKDVELPAQTGMLVRLDSSLSLPQNIVRSAAAVTTPTTPMTASEPPMTGGN